MTSSLLLSQSHAFLFPNPSPRFPRVSKFSIRASDRKTAADGEAPNPSPRPPTERKSLAVVTGELFLGLASWLTRTRSEGPEVLVEGGGVYFKGEGEETGKLVEDEEVVWEQREKDVEAERERKKVTSPGFSFSAAGLLFPYHLGVAQCLIDKGYIKVSFFLFFF